MYWIIEHDLEVYGVTEELDHIKLKYDSANTYFPPIKQPPALCFSIK